MSVKSNILLLGPRLTTKGSTFNGDVTVGVVGLEEVPFPSFSPILSKTALIDFYFSAWRENRALTLENCPPGWLTSSGRRLEVEGAGRLQPRRLKGLTLL